MMAGIHGQSGGRKITSVVVRLFRHLDVIASKTLKSHTSVLPSSKTHFSCLLISCDISRKKVLQASLVKIEEMTMSLTATNAISFDTAVVAVVSE